MVQHETEPANPRANAEKQLTQACNADADHRVLAFVYESGQDTQKSQGAELMVWPDGRDFIRK